MKKSNKMPQSAVQGGQYRLPGAAPPPGAAVPPQGAPAPPYAAEGFFTPAPAAHTDAWLQAGPAAAAAGYGAAPGPAAAAADWAFPAARPPAPFREPGEEEGGTFDPADLEDWQELDGNSIKCRACNKHCDGVHETTADHKKRLETWRWEQKAEEQDYAAPPQPFLAFVADETFGNGKYLRCLLCKKWVQDWECIGDVADYSGNHGNKGPHNGKDHAKRLNNLSEYLEDLAEEKAIYHPPAAAQQRQASSARGSAPRVTGIPPPPAFLPHPWQAYWDPQSQAYYFSDGAVTTWDAPT